MTMPLEGIRVLDWTLWQQGPAAAAMLGDLGAEVIKIEERVGGDPGRGLLTIAGVMAEVSGQWSFYFENFNRNKKGITLDIRKEKGREILYRLVEKSDVFVHNFRQGVAERLGIDYETLSRYNPRLIYAHASASGPQGPDSAKTGMDYTFQARSGLMASIGEPDLPPQRAPPGIADQMGATMLSYAILVALIARERKGVGQKVEASALGSMIWLQQLTLGQFFMLGAPPPSLGRREAANPLWNHYQCQDEKWIVLAMLQSDRYWADLCQVLGREDLATDPKFDDMFRRSENHEELIDILDEIFRSKPRDEWMGMLKEGGDFIFGPVNSPLDLAQDPQVVANHYIAEFDHPSLGAIKLVGIPFHFSETPGELRLPAPEFGQHTEEVLLEIGGYSWEEIEKLRIEEVI
ncbi:MAG: CaiB/BaiF CoA transferase family protein [Dehalococcoidia bacterium]